MEDTLTLIEQLSSRFNLSDEGSIALHSLVKSILPRDDILPSGYTTIRKNKQNFNNQLRVLEKSADNSICILKFRSQLIRILEKHFNSILNYSEFRQQNKELDFNPLFLRPLKIENNSLQISLLLFADGVKIKKSTIENELWPVRLQIANLPPKLRVSRPNVALAA